MEKCLEYKGFYYIETRLSIYYHMSYKRPPPPGVYKFAKVLSLIVGILFCLISLAAFSEGSILGGLFLLLIGGFFILYFFKQKVPPPPIMQDSLRAEAVQYIRAAQESGEFPVVSSSLIFPAGEKCYLHQAVCILSEPRAVSESVGSKSSLRIAKGVYIRGNSARRISHQEIQEVDTGELVLTNRNLYFKGRQSLRTVVLSRIISLDMVQVGYNSFAIEIGQRGIQKKETFNVVNPFSWTYMIKTFKAMEENKISLKQMKLDM